MSFSRVNAAGWAVGDPLTSAQQNGLDIDHANALDRSTAGDTILGLVKVQGASARFEVTNSSLGGIGFKADVGSTMDLNGAINVNVGAVFSYNYGLSSFVLGAAHTVQAVLDAGSFLEVTGGGFIQVPDPTSIILSPAVTRTVHQGIVVPGGLQTGWTSAGIGVPPVIAGPATTVPQPFLITQLHNGARLASVKCHVFVKGAHVGVPAAFPSFNVYRSLIADGQALGNQVSLFSGGAKFFTAANAAAWDNGNLQQSATFTCDQNHTIDTANYEYFVVIIDENGVNAVAGNDYIGFELDYTTIGSMKFP